MTKEELAVFSTAAVELNLIDELHALLNRAGEIFETHGAELERFKAARQTPLDAG